MNSGKPTAPKWLELERSKAPTRFELVKEANERRGMDIGKESEPYVVEPVEDPIPRERELPQPDEEPIEAPELVPA